MCAINRVSSIAFQNIIPSIEQYLLDLQNRICQMIEAEDGQAIFVEDPWSHIAGGGGLTRVLNGGQYFERAGVNFSHVWGDHLPAAATEKRPMLQGATFRALGISIVIHPLNPYIPTAHCNVRFIYTEKAGVEPTWWFGGGFDLTPYYGFVEDCVHWHQVAKKTCEPFGQEVYQQYKKWADDYFYLPHRQEQRGIGGIFFDDLNHWDFDDCFAFIRNVGDHFLLAYQPIVARRKLQLYSQKEREFQLYRRGRYIEFNLLYDRGTLFGLQSKGRTESILMSLPPLVSFEYDRKSDSKERELIEVFLKPKDWITSHII